MGPERPRHRALRELPQRNAAPRPPGAPIGAVRQCARRAGLKGRRERGGKGDRKRDLKGDGLRVAKRRKGEDREGKAGLPGTAPWDLPPWGRRLLAAMSHEELQDCLASMGLVGLVKRLYRNPAF
ncbi:unnamed protein product [Ostreobium quekettii]|uniref:Uncharacterized protein n=1 Tax=Ostreobium quekettii TaxID=121088 RepID=A0A8S1IQS0_9CHLO|nr:unnamed protein product [Ostreobium quekettii]